ncbi:MAG: hypothetical protein GY679_00810 [Mycoplasma sp.]|nr:hypothetical protein [Mycoplasma sp.]
MELYKGDCLEIMNELKSKSIDIYVHEYKSIPLTDEEIAAINKQKRKETLRLILDLVICLIFAPAISGFIGWLVPLPFSILTAILIGLIALEYFTGRRA